MKVVTLDQPIASLVADGREKVITLPHLTTHRGPLAIHASRKPASDGIDALVKAMPEDEALHTYLYSTVFPLGAVIAIADLTDVFPLPTGKYAWRVGHVVRVGPVVTQGQEGLWEMAL